MALAFAEAGADVVIASRTHPVDAVAEQVRAPGGAHTSLSATWPTQRKTAELADAAVEEFGQLDIVVNNVGGTMPAPLLDPRQKTSTMLHLQRATAHAHLALRGRCR